MAIPGDFLDNLGKKQKTL